MKTRNISQSVLIGALAWLGIGQGNLAQSAEIASSITEFSGNQGQNGWFYGYRYFYDGLTVDYDVSAEFLPFAGGVGQGDWDGFGQQWTGSAWDLNTSEAPWTYLAAEGVHPNGINNGEEHWVIRRWTASELGGNTWLGVQWNVRKENLNGAGVTGALHVNGVRVQSAAVAGNDGVGVTQTYWVVAKSTDVFDVILSPVGPSGDTGDGADGSFTWMVVTATADTDGDSLPDAWEEMYFPGDLTKLSGSGDYDADGLKDLVELQRGTDPTKSDTDADGLVDGVETDTGTYVNPTDTGTSPIRADTDGDGRTDGDEVNGDPKTDPIDPDSDDDNYSDGSEVGSGHDPNDGTNNPDTTWIAHSRLEFSTDGSQGANDWYGGYRNYTADGGGINYNPDTAFIPFSIESWTGGGWDLAPSTAPWTELGAEGTHPAGASPTHWTVRRWVATELTKTTPLALRWHVRKSNVSCGNGVTGALYINGQRMDAVTNAFDNGTGFTRTFFANVEVGDKIDLILSPRGTDNADADGCDGSVNWLVIDPTIPPNPKQPDGSPFIPAGAGDTDADGMPDAWEEIYFPGDLTKLTQNGDYDADGLKDPGEYTRSSDPTNPDTDGDGLGDLVETGTGVYVSPTDTGSSPTKTDGDGDGIDDYAEVTGVPPTDPNKADTDGDGFSDLAEFEWGTNPVDPTDNPLAQVIANSEKEFSGTQGQNGWSNGYRIYTDGVSTVDYDPNVEFIPFDEYMWTGALWDLDSGGAAPWTTIGALDLHPNGNNNGEEHWPIRRWVAAEVTQTIPVALIWNARKGNANPTGVTGSLHVNGVQVDHLIISGTDTTGQIRRFYVNLKPNDIVDLALTPEGLNGDRGDNYDGSITWFWVDKKIPKEPRQPDGSLFIPIDAKDTDADGLLDFWELIYAADLTVLTGTGDNDSDGVANTVELARDSNPLVTDTDGDGLGDAVETKTGTFVGAADTGTDPRKADTDGDGRPDGEEINGSPTTDPHNPDTDGDGFSDGAEVASGHDPNDPDHNPNTTVIADSIVEFTTTGEQGVNGWFYGYRNVTVDGGAQNYNPDTAFIPFPAEVWTGTQFDLNTAGAPWTELGPQNTHPNAGTGDTQWTIRRWVATELTKATPLGVRWHTRHVAVTCGGNGITGLLYVNGVLQDSAVIPFTDGTGVIRTYYINAQPGDKIDLALSAKGTDGLETDGCDGSANWFQVDPTIPLNPKQPDGTPFIPAGSQITVTSAYNAAQSQLTLNWNAVAGSTYTVWGTMDLKAWVQVQTGIAAGSHTIQIGATPAYQFYRVSQP